MSENEGLFAFNIQKVNISTDIGCTALYELGHRKPYYRTVDFPVEIQTELLYDFTQPCPPEDVVSTGEKRMVSDHTTFSFCEKSEVGPFTKKLVKLAQQVYARQGNIMNQALGGITSQGKITITGKPVVGKNARIFYPTQSIGITGQSGSIPYSIGGSGGWNLTFNPIIQPVPKFKSGTQVTSQFSGKRAHGTIRCAYVVTTHGMHYDIDLDSGYTIFGIPECDVSLLSVCFEQPFDYEITNDLVPQVCTCKTLDLMVYGCKCGSFQKEQNMKDT